MAKSRKSAWTVSSISLLVTNQQGDTKMNTAQSKQIVETYFQSLATGDLNTLGRHCTFQPVNQMVKNFP